MPTSPAHTPRLSYLEGPRCYASAVMSPIHDMAYMHAAHRDCPVACKLRLSSFTSSSGHPRRTAPSWMPSGHMTYSTPCFRSSTCIQEMHTHQAPYRMQSGSGAHSARCDTAHPGVPVTRPFLQALCTPACLRLVSCSRSCGSSTVERRARLGSGAVHLPVLDTWTEESPPPAIQLPDSALYRCYTRSPVHESRRMACSSGQAGHAPWLPRTPSHHG